MIDEDYSKFRMDGEEPDEESPYREEIKDRRVEKLSHRVTFITILIPCLIGIILYFVYRDLTRKVTMTQDTGSLEVQNLTLQLEEKFSDLSTKYNDLEASLVDKMIAVEKINNVLKANLKKTEKTLKKINASKVDIKDQKSAIAKIDVALAPIREKLKAIAPIREDLKAVSSEVKVVSSEVKMLDKDLKQQLIALTANVGKAIKDLTKIQSDISALSSQKLGKETLQLELLKAKKNYQKELALMRVGFENKLASILKKIKDLEKIAQAPLANVKPEAQTVMPKSGGIIEQNIKE